MKPDENEYCAVCHLAFLSLKEQKEAKLTKEGWVHMDKCMKQYIHRED